DVDAGTRLLLNHRAGLEVLRLALLDTGSPYAGALVAVCSTLPPLVGDERDAVARLAAEGPPDESVGLEPYGMPGLAEARS
ncbi:MAG: nitrate reductase molybdenum cofactor assembly chaperone, partial [Cellulomonas sp.]